MDVLTVIIIAAVIAVVVVIAFVLARNKQRSGTVLAAPESATEHRDSQHRDPR